MREYETICILNPATPAGDVEEFAKKIGGQIQKHNGTLLLNKQEGKKSVSYLMEKQKEGNFLHFDYSADGTVVADLERTFRLDERVLRFLTIKLSDNVDIEARKIALSAL